MKRVADKFRESILIRVVKPSSWLVRGGRTTGIRTCNAAWNLVWLLIFTLSSCAEDCLGHKTQMLFVLAYQPLQWRVVGIYWSFLFAFRLFCSLFRNPCHYGITMGIFPDIWYMHILYIFPDICVSCSSSEGENIVAHRRDRGHGRTATFWFGFIRLMSRPLCGGVWCLGMFLAEVLSECTKSCASKVFIETNKCPRAGAQLGPGRLPRAAWGARACEANTLATR